MKNNKLYYLALSSLLLSFIMIITCTILVYKDYQEKNSEHLCIDSTHTKCDEYCECDGFQCVSKPYGIKPRSYQIELELTHNNIEYIYIYDHNRLVDSVSYNDTTNKISEIILKDNL